MRPQPSWRKAVFARIDSLAECTSRMRQVLRDYTDQGFDRSRERFERAHAMSQEVGWPFARHTALDVGCGSGSGLLVLARNFKKVTGADVDLEGLVLARQLVKENNLSGIEIVPGDATRLPFDDNSFDFVTGLDFLHHVEKPGLALAEIRRVLKPGGVAALDSANRYALGSPEPHVKLWGVGFLPRPLQETYVRFRLRVSYASQHARLMSVFELRGLLKESFGKNFRLYSPFLWKDVPRKGAGFIRFLRRRCPFLVEWSHILFLLVTSNHEFLVLKKKDHE